MANEQILEKVNEAMKLGRKQALVEVYEEIRNLFNYRIRTHNRDFENAKSEQYKYDLSRDAREFNANFNMVLDSIKERIETESEPQESDLGDYPDAVHDQFDNMTGSMNL